MRRLMPRAYAVFSAAMAAFAMAALAFHLHVGPAHAVTGAVHLRSTTVLAAARSTAAPVDGWSVLESQLSPPLNAGDAPQPNWLNFKSSQLANEWKSKCDLWPNFYSNCTPPLGGPSVFGKKLFLEPTVQVTMAKAAGTTPAPVSQSGTQTVAYNPAAYSVIQSSKLDQSVTWQNSLAQGKQPALTGSGFTDTALIVKEEFAPPLVVSGPCHTACTQTLKVITPATMTPHTAATGSASPGMQTITLNLDPTVACSATSFAQGSSAPVPLNCFHYVATHGTSAGIQSIVTSDQLPGAGYGDNAIVYIVLGFHLIRADTPEWTWTTYWWTPDPSADPTHCTRPTGMLVSTKPWTFYCMDAMTQESQTNLQQAHFNPYIEGLMGGSTSNCLYCHSRAMYRQPQSGTSYTQTDMATAIPANNKPLSPPLIPCETTGSADPFCKGGISTLFLWSLATHFDPNNPANPQQGSRSLSSGTSRSRRP